MYAGFIVKIEELRKHSNADRLQVSTILGSNVILGLDTKVGDIGVYFPTDGALGEEYCAVNDLVRRKDESGNNCGGYLDPVKRNIKAISLRGEQSDGLFMPLKSLESFTKIEDLKVGDRIDVLNGVVICEKYVPRTKGTNINSTPKRQGPKVTLTPLFVEHGETPQLGHCLSEFKPNDIVEITLKMHGTSQRTGLLPTYKGHKRTLLDKILRRAGKPIYDYGYVTGTRRVNLGELSDKAAKIEGGFYGSDAFRVQHADKFKNKLHKGETVYYEVVGYTDSERLIMGSCSNEKGVLGKDFVKKYGKETKFTYGCGVGTSECYVYRMTMTNEDGFVVEYSPFQLAIRCAEIGVKVVPSFGIFDVGSCMLENETAGECVFRLAAQFESGEDPIGKTHTREGVIVRKVNSSKIKAYKQKCFDFKVLEGIIKDNADAPDMEEASGMEE